MKTALEVAAASTMVLLIIVGTYETRSRKKRRATLSGIYADEVTALFNGTKRVELDHREAAQLIRIEHAEAAPPLLNVDLENGTAILRPKKS